MLLFSLSEISAINICEEIEKINVEKEKTIIIKEWVNSTNKNNQVKFFKKIDKAKTWKSHQETLKI